MAEAVSTKSTKGKSNEQVQKRPAEIASQPAATGPYSSVLSLQRSAGNRAVSRLLASDMNTLPAGGVVLQRKCAACAASGGECEECRKKKPLQRASLAPRGRDKEADGQAPPIVRDVLRSPGRSLEPAARVFFESRFHHDFSHVQVHADANAAESARAVNSLAYTVGRHVVFGAGQYAPGTTPGKNLLAHELTHVIQQSRTAADDGGPLRLGDPSSISEREADAAAGQAMAPHTSEIRPGAATPSPGVLQRACITDPECKPAEKGEKPGSAVKGSPGHFIREVEREEKERAVKQKRKTPRDIRRELCNKAPPDPGCTGDGHGRRASAFEELFRPYAPPALKLVKGIFVDKDIEPGFGAYKWDCRYFTPKIEGDQCIFIPEHRENEASLYKKGEKTIAGWDREEWLTHILMLSTHELEHARFEKEFPESVPGAGKCKFEDVSGNLTELAAILSEFPVLYRASASKPWHERRAAFADWFDRQIRQPKKHGERIAGILKSMKCLCECNEVNAYIRKTAEFTTAGWTDAEKFTLHTELSDPKWELDWPIKTPPPPRDLPAFTLTPSFQFGYGHLGSGAIFLGTGLDVGIPIDRLGKWQLLLGAQGRFISGLELNEEQRSAYLLGLKVGFLRGPALGTRGLQFGAFGEVGGGRFEQGFKGEGGAYAGGGVSLRYSPGLVGRVSPFLGVEAVGGARIDTTKPEVQKWIFAGISATAGLQF